MKSPSEDFNSGDNATIGIHGTVDWKANTN